ncbi:MAG: dihydrodipicolinate synthase family protein, partial [SAR202 cluster bacterium]|nr:dihydrodipicolinate synthase family protein [SAR202 cluster bacterium]
MTTNGNKYFGVMVPILTPLTPDKKVDAPSLRRLVRYLVDNGVHGIWASGTTAEFPALNDRERMVSIDVVVQEVAGKVPVIANVSNPSTQLTVDLGMEARESGADAIAATPPYYYSHTPGEMADHFRYIRDQVGVPLWVYNIPPMVKTPVPPATVVELAAEGAVEGIKDSSGAGELLAELNIRCDQANVSLYRMLGTTLRITTAQNLGAHGVIPGIANLIPEISAKGWEAGTAGDWDTAKKYDARIMLADKVQKLGRSGCAQASIYSGMKSALKMMGVIDHDTVTRPLQPLSETERE